MGMHHLDLRCRHHEAPRHLVPAAAVQMLTVSEPARRPLPQSTL
jgi:hypothetical protein